MEIRFDHNVDQVRRDLSDFARGQLPFATALALNATAEDVKRNADKLLDRKLDRPTPFTRRAFTVWRASKRKLEATVFAKDAQAEYLQYAESGGPHTPRGRAMVVPSKLRRNKFGNMPKGAIKKALARPTVFSGDPDGSRPGGIYERTRRGRGLRLLVVYAQRLRYTPRLGFQDAARKTAEARMAHHLGQSLGRAIDMVRR